ncbi:MAG: hypothetical protein GY806_02610 [Gammaproteobacteria bacterium]|nr:hypothetical protein [Gammaproteobacteria bacterium]
MTTKEHLVEQHIREYESRQKHVNELIERANQASINFADDHDLKIELAKVRDEHGELVEETEKLKKMPLEHWREETIQSAGPMAIWDVIAQKLEDLVERIEK